MAISRITKTDLKHIAKLVAHYQLHFDTFCRSTEQLRLLIETPELRSLYHSARWRVKDPEHLRDKLLRKLQMAKETGQEFNITQENLFEKINDLAGIRLLHLHFSQFENINRALLSLLEENMYSVIEGPIARTWDDEYRSYYEKIGVKTISSESMYTSIHYVIELNARSKRTAEIQVRTLAEELWGEVDHTINYPHESQSLACREQIKVLARLTSSCTRLVDAIFATHNESSV